MSSRLPDIHAKPQPAATDPGGGHPISDAERAVLDAVRDLAYGQVEVIVHSSRIVQITRSQKLRLNGDAA